MHVIVFQPTKKPGCMVVVPIPRHKDHRAIEAGLHHHHLESSDDRAKITDEHTSRTLMREVPDGSAHVVVEATSLPASDPKYWAINDGQIEDLSPA